MKEVHVKRDEMGGGARFLAGSPNVKPVSLFNTMLSTILSALPPISCNTASHAVYMACFILGKLEGI
jgi:hypothetical protein